MYWMFASLKQDRTFLEIAALSWTGETSVTRGTEIKEFARHDFQ